MRKLIFTAVLSFLTSFLFAQLDDVAENIDKGKWAEAKDKLDKFMAVEKNANNVDAWYFKSLIYLNLSKDSTQPAGTVLANRNEAMNAYKRYLELDKKNIRGTLVQNVVLFDLYQSNSQAGIDAYNSKKYMDAHEFFKASHEIGKFINSKSFSYNNYNVPQIDTFNILYAGVSAIQAKDLDKAVGYYQMLADAKVSGPDNLEIYQFLVDYYLKKNDVANKDKYLAIGKALYPKNDYWCQVELQGLEEDFPKLFAAYDRQLAGDCNSYVMHFNYAAELFNYLYTQDKKPADYVAMQSKIETVLKGALAVQTTPEANLLMARHMYNVIYDIQDALVLIKGTKAEDVKKRNDLKAQMNAKLDAMLPYALAAYDGFSSKSTLKPSDKGNLKITTDLIFRYYEQKNDKVKMKEWQDKMKSIDTM